MSDANGKRTRVVAGYQTWETPTRLAIKKGDETVIVLDHSYLEKMTKDQVNSLAIFGIKSMAAGLPSWQDDKNPAQAIGDVLAMVADGTAFVDPERGKLVRWSPNSGDEESVALLIEYAPTAWPKQFTDTKSAEKYVKKLAKDKLDAIFQRHDIIGALRGLRAMKKNTPTVESI